ncbi:hypothetical protein D3C80_1340380 [compost metagenome]
MLHAVLERTVANQMGHRAAQADHQAGEDERGGQAGEHGDAGSDVTAQLAGDLRAGQGIAPGRQEADQKQRSRGQALDHGHGRALVAGIKQRNQAQDDRGREQAAAGGVGQAQAQGTGYRGVEETADVEGQREAGQRRQGIGQQVAEQAAGALALVQPWGGRSALAEPAAEAGKHREAGGPGEGQQDEVARQLQRIAGRVAVDQAFHFLGRAVGAQAPGIDQVGIEVELLGGAVQAVGQGAKKAALQDRCGFDGLFFGGGGVSG